ncbi:S8 family serine peptidase [Candidatus Poribacteria bacterium]
MKTSKCGSQLTPILILTTLMLFPGVAWTQTVQKYIALDDGLKTVSASQKHPVIVQFQSAPTEAEYDQLEKQIGAFVLKHRYSIIPGMAAELTRGQIEILSRMPIVRSVEYDQPVRAFLDSATYWSGVDDAVSLPGGVTGDGVTIAMIDTGIDAKHSDLNGGKIVAWVDYVNGRRSPYDDNGHGTHTASIAAGAGDGNPAYTGVAPGASLVGIKALNSTGDGTVSDIAAGIDWCVNNKDTYGIRIINLSLGTVSPGTSPSLITACVNAVNSGIVVVVAAGDDGPATNTIVDTPRDMAEVITVGAMADPGQKGFYQWYKSSRGDPITKPDISAPGYKIMAAKAGNRNGYIEMTGTSMASAFVAGIAALILDGDDTLLPIEVKSRIMDAAEDWGPLNQDIDYGAGKLDAYKAITNSPNSNIDISDLKHFYAVGSLPGEGTSDYWEFVVTDTETDDGTPYPIALTLIMDQWVDNNYDFDVYLYGPNYATDPNDSLVDISFGAMRQEMLGSFPAATGIYTLEVRSYRGSGPYFFDLSAVVDQPPVLIDDDYTLTDIAVTSVDAPNPVVQGSSVNVNVRVKNVGTLDVTSDITVTLTDDIGGYIGTRIISGGLDAYDTNPPLLIFVWDTGGADLGDHTLTASHDFVDADPTNNSKISSIVTVSEGSTNAMHVGSVEVTLVQAGPNTSAVATVTIFDASNAPVPGATVECLWSIGPGPYGGGINSGTTDTLGKASLSSDKVRKAPTGTIYTCTVISVALADWVYDETANVETSDSDTVTGAPTRAYQNISGEPFPNPGNPEIWMPFALSEAEHVVIRVYNATGRLVRTLDLGQKSPGTYMNKEQAAHWDGRNEAGDRVTSGTYFYLMEAGSFRAMKKLAILK